MLAVSAVGAICGADLAKQNATYYWSTDIETMSCFGKAFTNQKSGDNSGLKVTNLSPLVHCCHRFLSQNHKRKNKMPPPIDLPKGKRGRCEKTQQKSNAPHPSARAPASKSWHTSLAPAQSLNWLALRLKAFHPQTLQNPSHPEWLPVYTRPLRP